MQQVYILCSKICVTNQLINCMMLQVNDDDNAEIDWDGARLSVHQNAVEVPRCEQNYEL